MRARERGGDEAQPAAPRGRLCNWGDVLDLVRAELEEIVAAAIRRELQQLRPPEGEWLSLQDAANVLRVSTKTVLKYQRHRGLPGKSLPGGGWRFKRADIEKWLEERAVAPGAHARKQATRLRTIRGGGED